MANTETSPGKPAIVDNSIFKLVLQLVVPGLLGVLVAYASSINDAQKKQGEQLSELKGQIGVMVQQNSDFVGRLTKVESATDDNRRAIGSLSGRVMVLESLRRK